MVIVPGTLNRQIYQDVIFDRAVIPHSDNHTLSIRLFFHGVVDYLQVNTTETLP